MTLRHSFFIGFASLLLLSFSVRAAEKPAEEPTGSAFVRAHENQAVKWLPWGDEAFRRARTEAKPLYVSIGAFTSELSRAMAVQSFGQPETAEFLNENFVCVLVDREENPAIASLYRTYLRTAKQLEGWPLNVWLTPELTPIEGATYLPPSEEWGKPGFMIVAKQVANAWQADPAAQRQKADEAVANIAAAEESFAPPPVSSAEIDRLIAEGTAAWKAKFDATHGGFGEPPKQLEPELLRFLLRDPAHRDLALETLSAMIDGGIRDQLDHGFFRQSSDAAWRQPYLQKTLVDQARMALALLDAAKHSKDPRYAEAARNALAYVLLFFGNARTGFGAAHDATGASTSGSFLWTMDEMQAVLGEREGRNFARTFGVTEEGNVPADVYPVGADAKKSVLYRATPRGSKMAEAEIQRTANKLMHFRRLRVPPRIDPNGTTGAHGLMLHALARAATELNEPRFKDPVEQTFVHIRNNLRTPDGGLRRLKGSEIPAAPEDYAFVIDGMLALNAATGDKEALALAEALRTEADNQFFDATSGRYFANRSAVTPGIWARVHVPTPSVGELPSAEAYMAVALCSHGASAGKPEAELSTLIAAIAAEVRDSGDAPRGELLLALRAYRERKN